MSRVIFEFVYTRHCIHVVEVVTIYNVFQQMDASIIFESTVYLLFDIRVVIADL